MKKTKAQKYWRDFEKFVLAYLKDKYNITEEHFAKLTPPSGDGGFDGIIYTSVDFSEKAIQEILFEAKLRSALGNALPMNEFSKSLIIAINRFAQGLYIVTNIAFSSDTIHELRVYARRTGIQISAVNGKELFEWYKNYSLSNNLSFETDFIDFLEESSKKVHNIISMRSVEESIEEKYIQDSYRKQELHNIEKIIQITKHGTLLIKGNRGSGKSCLCKILKNSLQEDGYLVTQIDIKEINTSRTIFLKLLEFIWGVSPELLIQCSDNELEEIFLEIGKEKLSKKDIQCLKQLFEKDITEYMGHSDVYQYVLLNIIDKLFKHYATTNYYCIHIHNLETGYYESCDFILKIIFRLRRYHILFLVELRDDYNKKMYLEEKEWNDILYKFENLDSIIEKHYVKLFSLKEKREYISTRIEGFTKEQMDILENSLPENPLILNAALDILTPRLKSKHLLLSEFQNEIDFFKNSYDSVIIRQVIKNKIYYEGYERLAMPFAMLAFLGGTCTIEIFQEIIEYDKVALIKDFSDIEIFNVQNEVISVKHEFYLNSLQNFCEYISNIALQSLAKKMLMHIDIFYKDALQKELLRIRLLDVVGEKSLLLRHSAELGRLLLKQGDLKQALHIYELGYKVFDTLSADNTDFDSKKVKTILLKLDILQNMLYIIENTVIEHYSYENQILDEFEKIIRENRHLLRHNTYYIKAVLNEMILKMRKFHRQAQHSECLKYAYKARRQARKANIYQNSPSTMEQILWLKELSIKHISGIHACMQSFESDIKKNPDLPLLMSSYHIHKTATISRKSPRLALQFFRLNEKYYHALPMSEQLHNRVNIANMHFFLKEYDKSIDLFRSIVSDAITYDIKIELGRIYNLAGNYYTIFNSFGEGIDFYKKSVEIFMEMNHQIHLWPPLVNLSTVFIYRDDYENAYNYLEKAANILMHRSIELKNSNKKDVDSSSKLYIGIIIVLHSLYLLSPHNEKAHILYQQFFNNTQKYMPENINTLVSSDKEYQSFFKNSAYEHLGKIVLKL